ncbi:MAG: ribosomal protein S18 acetylase RimI-like enzyme [Kiritimatiellia bacterium]|jgi:ribosomal protein S18 acetylase RimI-like enzyme
MNAFTVITPESEAELEAYYALRYETLRKPWNQPPTANQPEDDDTASHVAVRDASNGTLVAVARLHFNSPDEAQIRLMGVDVLYRGQGLGRMLMEHLEQVAQAQGAHRVILHARDYAVGFYEKLGYTSVELSYLLFDEIQHILMRKVWS